MAAVVPCLDEALELAALVRPAWGEIAETIPTWHPRNEGEPDADADADKPDADADADKPDADTDADADKDKEPDWKAESRKHERRAKAEKKAREDAEKKLKEQEDADKSEQEKAIEKAKEEGRTAALTEAQKERRSDRLEVAVTRLAAKGVKVGDKDGVKFADPEDAQILIEKAIARGDIDEDEIYDSEGKVQTEALTTALSDLLTRKPHLADSANGRPSGESDAGKGSAGKGLDDMSVEEHFQAIKRT